MRPFFHFTAPANWINDPNGLVHVDGVYHLFYQHHPFDDRFGPPHWGHAVSHDLVKWEHRPIALAPDELGLIFSGSAVIDHEGTAGFGRGAMVAAFTHHLRDGVERQSLAFSTDGGETWEKYRHNPVLEAPDDVRDFRDPKVIRWESETGSHWVMLLAVGVAVWIYTSHDLIHWEHASVFEPDEWSARVWECPDLFELPIDGGPDSAWVLTVGAQGVALPHEYATRFFVGRFDGTTFSTEQRELHWADHGADFYAAQSWSDMPHRRRVWVGWMNNWAYADEVPSAGWRGAMSVPRALGLRSAEVGLRLTQQPVPELEAYRRVLVEATDVAVVGDRDPLHDIRGVALDLELAVDLAATTASGLVLDVRVGHDEYTRVAVDLAEMSVSVDRQRAGEHLFHREYGGPRLASAARDGDTLDIRVLVDTTSVEVFAADGLLTITEQIFPHSESDRARLAAVDGEVVLARLAAFTIEGAAAG